MRKVKLDLDGLPKSFADNPQAHLLSLCAAFISDLDSYTNGKPTYPPDQPTFIREAAPYYRVLEKEIKRTRPEFKISRPCPTESVSEGLEDESPDGAFRTLRH